MMRWRLLFSRGEEVKFLSHSDLMRLWERALRRAGMPLAYSQGFSPHPRLCLALPLPVGVTGEAEMAELWLQRPMDLLNLMSDLARQLPEGVEVRGAEAVPAHVPSLPSLVQGVEYQVNGEGRGVVEATKAFLAAATFPWRHSSPKGERAYDLRPMVEDLWLWGEGVGMRLHPRARAHQVALALGLSPHSIHRTHIILRGG